jgi:excisionase family DNA binding protein
LTLRLKEVVADLKVQPATAYRLIKSGKLKAFKIGNQYRVSEEELTRYKEEATNETMSQR